MWHSGTTLHLPPNARPLSLPRSPTRSPQTFALTVASSTLSTNSTIMSPLRTTSRTPSTLFQMGTMILHHPVRFSIWSSAHASLASTQTVNHLLLPPTNLHLWIAAPTYVSPAISMRLSMLLTSHPCLLQLPLRLTTAPTTTAAPNVDTLHFP